MLAKRLDNKVSRGALRKSKSRQLELSGTLLKLSDLIGDASDPDELGYAASEILGNVLGVSRVGYAAIDPDAETLHVSKDWTAPGVVSLAGILQLRDYGSFIDSLKRGEFISIADVRQDDRTIIAAAALESASARSFVNVPVIEQDRLRAVMYVNHAEQRAWSNDELALIQEVARRTRTAMGRLAAEADLRASEERQAFLLTLSDATRHELDTQKVAEITCRRLAEHMNGSRVQYLLVEGEPGAEMAEVCGEFVVTGPPLTRRFPLESYGEEILAPLRHGHTLVLNDSEEDTRLKAEQREAFRLINSPSAIAAPLVKGGRFAGTFTIHDSAARRWTPEEIALVEEVAERTWAAVERTHAEAALREREEQLRALTLASHSSLYEMSADWSVMSQFHGDDFLADTTVPDPDWRSKYIHPLDQQRVQTTTDAAIKSKSVCELEHRVLREDGSVGWTVSRAVPIFDENGDIRKWFGAANDITAKKRMEAEFRQREKLTAVGQLASTIAHEINNPLESVTNLLYLARTSSAEPLVVEYLNSADIELRRVAAITSQTLQFHKQLSKPTQAIAEGLLSAALNTYEGRIRNSDIRTELRNRATGTFECFEGEIQQVLNNLIGNAIDVMRQDGGRLILRSSDAFDWKSGQPSVRITVADSGTGIPHELLEDIFQPFFTTKGLGGTGLGLWISKEIVDHHKGHLRVRSSSREGRTGTVFTVLLPRHIEVTSAYSERP